MSKRTLHSWSLIIAVVGVVLAAITDSSICFTVAVLASATTIFTMPKRTP